MAKRLPSFGLKTIDPLEISRLVVDQGNAGPISLSLDFWDLKFEGFRRVKVVKIRSDLDKPWIETEAVIPGKLIIRSNYKSKGRILLLPLLEEGDCVLTLDNITAAVKIDGVKVKKGEQTYMKVTKFLLKFDTDKLTLDMHNKLNRGNNLSGVTNQFLNENWREILKEVKPAFQEALGQAFKAITVRIFDKVPFDRIFID